MSVNAFIAAYLLFAVFWDTPEANLLNRKIKTALQRLVIGLGLSYRWNMYAGPFPHIIELEARVRRADGTFETLPLPPRYEFRRYAFMLARQNNERLYQGLADYLASQVPPSILRPTEIVIVRRVAKTAAHVGSWRRCFTVAPLFRESIVARRPLA